MFCLVMLIILVVLSVFSASSRTLVREALDCVLRKATLRPCITGFDEKMKAKILGTVITRSEAASRLLNRNFELLAWAFFLLIAASGIWVTRGVYLFYTTGSCSGLNRDSFCVFDPRGESNQVSVPGSCPIAGKNKALSLSLKGVDLGGIPGTKGRSAGEVVMIGCYGCPYSRKVYGQLKELAARSGASFTFIDFPVKVQTDLMTRLGLCVYRRDEAKYWELNDILFATAPAKLDDPAFVPQAASTLGLDGSEVQRCVNDPATEAAVGKALDEANKTNFYGTPTVFVNGRPFVGPKPYRVYAIALQGLFYWLK